MWRPDHLISARAGHRGDHAQRDGRDCRVHATTLMSLLDPRLLVRIAVA